MIAVGPVPVVSLFPELHAKLMESLAGMDHADWTRPTACPGWSVRDLAAHLLDGDIRKLSGSRDGFRPPPPAVDLSDYQNLVAFLNDLNAQWVAVARRMSPRLLTEFLALTGPQVSALFASLDPQAPARIPVAWAGDTVSPNWFDIGREYTERWHHQQQIRDAAGQPPITSRKLLHPVLALFLRALPHTYRHVEAPPGTTITVRISGEARGDWSVLREGGRWSLFDGAPSSSAHAEVHLQQDTAWRLLTNAYKSGEAAALVECKGDAALASVFLRTAAVVA
ncbi:MAG: maleylpyruvate isomerase N-terminal domain-containing protein [Bryobacteraceae bacterium]